MSLLSSAPGLRPLVARMRHLLACRRGNFALTTALILPILLASGGAALDIGTATSLRANLQSAMDAAVLSSTKQAVVDPAKARAIYIAEADASNNTSGSGKWFEITSTSFNLDSTSGKLTGTSVVKVNTAFGAMMGLKSFDMTVTSVAQYIYTPKIIKATFKVLGAQGAYDKDIYFFTRDKTGAIISRTLILQYNYAPATGGVLVPPAALSTTINVGDYASYGYQMTVFEDPTYTGRRVNPVSHYSDDADAARWTRTDATASKTCQSAGGINNFWEDGGDSNYLDFRFNVTCVTTQGNIDKVVLSK